MKYEYFANEDLYARVEVAGEQLDGVLERIHNSKMGRGLASLVEE